VIGIGIRYLNGWAMATHPADRERPEWPPHPDRVFMALAAAHFETGADRAEAALLERLEAEPPVLWAGRHGERDTVTTYVPVNDTASPLQGSGKTLRPSAPLGSLPIGRVRQARQFPVAVPEEPTVHLRWPGLELSPAERRALAGLCTKVTYVGHSASLVQAWLEEGEVDMVAQDGRAELLPVGSSPARYRLRVPAPGRLERLRADFAAGVRPRASAWFGYEPRPEPAPEVEAPVTCFDPALLVLCKLDGPGLGLESTLQVTKALRDTVLSSCPDPPPEWVSGHRQDGSPSERDHLAFLPLPHIGREHADGHLLGLSLAVPREVGPEDRRRCLGPLLFDQRGHPREIELRMGRLGLWKLQLEEREMRPFALRPETWSAVPPAAAARRWATVTPIALDRHPKGADRWRQIEASIRRGCRRIGLPEPEHVVVSPVSLFAGAPQGHSFPMLHRGGGEGRVQHTHAVLIFGEPVCGPVLVGAGRYRGYGLCRPLGDSDEGAP
jgi:CRISPR-associated protein Csb2